MYHRIVVPLDGSTFAEHALSYAALVARQAGARLDLALVHTSYSVATMDASIHETVERWQSEQRAREASYLHELAARLRSESGVQAEPVLLVGTVPVALQEYIAGSRADLVIMTTHGRGGLERVWLGSVADALVRHVQVPVLLVRPTDEEPALGADRPLFRHVVVALDGSGLAEHSLQSVLALADPDTAITLLRVVTPPRGPTTPFLPHASQLNRQLTDEREHEAEQYLANLVTGLAPRHAAVGTCVVTDYHPAEAIVRWAEEHGADGIAVSTRGHTPALRLLLGSVTDRVVRGGQVPVLVG